MASLQKKSCVQRFMGNPSQNYGGGVSLAIWDHTVLPATPTQLNATRLNPSQTGWYSTYLPGGMEG